jgi:hypothetical protein
MASTTKDTYNNHISLLFFSQLNTDTGSTNQTLSYCSLIKNFIIDFCLAESVCIHTFIMCGVCADSSCVHLSLDSCSGMMEMLEILPSPEHKNPFCIRESISVFGEDAMLERLGHRVHIH